jgi:hypothetical protein
MPAGRQDHIEVNEPAEARALLLDPDPRESQVDRVVE